MTPPERRKVRRGTRSCWECKRRKSRCTFTTTSPSESDICDGCQRRGTRCVGQELPDPGRLGGHENDRLTRVEALLEQLLERMPISSSESRRAEEIERIDLPASSGSANRTSHMSLNVPGGLHEHTRTGPGKMVGHIGMTRALSPPFIPPSLTSHHTARYDKTRHSLLKVWPSESDLSIIFQLPLEFNECEHGLILPLSSPRPTASGVGTRSSYQLLRPPPSTSHPVLYARRLLTLAFLLRVAAPVGSHLGELSVSSYDLMDRIMEAVGSLVNCVDNMVGSVEGVECIALESMYYHHSGDLNRAWITLRRAMSIAQTMGIHRNSHVLSSPPTSNERRLQSRLQQVWYTLVHFDRYLSLTLRLPQYSSESPFASPTELDACWPEEKLRRLDCASAGRILQQRDSKVADVTEIMETDRMLQDGARHMPVQWWLCPNVKHILGDKPNPSEQSARLLEQIRHYHLITQLHWPFLLRFEADSKHKYSKITVVNASREVLARCVALYGLNSVGYCSSAINYIALIASTALCLAHLGIDGCGCPSSHMDSFTHQRPSDRAMMEQALKSIEAMHWLVPGTDGAKITSAFQRLLLIEAEAARGSRYLVRYETHEHAQAYPCDETTENDNTLSIEIPAVGPIRIEPQVDSLPALSVSAFFPEGGLGPFTVGDEMNINDPGCSLFFDHVSVDS